VPDEKLSTGMVFFVCFQYIDSVGTVFLLMSNTILDNLAESFIQQCMSRVMEQSYDKEKYIAAAVEIENCIFGREVYDNEKMNLTDIWFIQDSWWDQYNELNHKDQQYVLNYIKDTFPDTWRP
jgi:hypothetical protein